MQLSFFIVFAGVLPGIKASFCLDGWVGFEETCYLFGRENMDFVTAESYCLQHNGHLVHINDAEENSFVKDQLRERPSVSYWWMGLTDEGTEGHWIFYNTSEAPNFTDFHIGDAGSHNGEDCAIFASKHDYEWADVVCSAQGHPVCEMTSEQVDLIIG